MMQKTDTRNKWTDAVQNTFVCQNSSLCTWETERDWWMVLSIQPEVYKEEGRELCVVRGTWMGWCDRYDWVQCPLKREREIQIDRNRDSAEEGSPWQTDRSRERNAERRQTDRSGRWDSEINPGGRWQNNLSEERVGPGRWREIYQELPRFRRFCFSGRKKKAAMDDFLMWPWSGTL